LNGISPTNLLFWVNLSLSATGGVIAGDAGLPDAIKYIRFAEPDFICKFQLTHYPAL
jgi:hypothetical protein